MQVCFANSTSLANLELFQKRATKWTKWAHGLNGYKSRLVKLGLLPITLYMELHDLLLFGKITGGEYQIDWQEHVATIQGKRPTRSTDHENFQDKKIFLTRALRSHFAKLLVVFQSYLLWIASTQVCYRQSLCIN